MALFVSFIVMGLILGVGMMLAPALPTPQPRVALSAVLSFAIVLSGALFHASLFGWNTLMVDYLWFALITGVFLGGTLTIGMQKYEAALAAGEDADSGWPSVRQMGVFFGWGICILLLISFLDASSTALAENVDLQSRIDAMNQSTSLENLDSLQGNIGPGIPVLLVYFDTQLPIEMDAVYGGLTVTLHVLLIWLFHDIALEISTDIDRRWLIMALSPVLAALFLSDIVLLGSILFVLAFWVFVVRWMRESQSSDLIAASICAAAAILIHPYSAIGLAIGYGVAVWFAPRQLWWQRWGTGTVLLTGLILIGLFPWLLTTV